MNQDQLTLSQSLWLVIVLSLTTSRCPASQISLVSPGLYHIIHPQNLVNSGQVQPRFLAVPQWSLRFKPCRALEISSLFPFVHYFCPGLEEQSENPRMERVSRAAYANSITSEPRRVQEKNRWRRDLVEKCGVV